MLQLPNCSTPHHRPPLDRRTRRRRPARPWPTSAAHSPNMTPSSPVRAACTCSTVHSPRRHHRHLGETHRYLDLRPLQHSPRLSINILHGICDRAHHPGKRQHRYLGRGIHRAEPPLPDSAHDPDQPRRDSCCFELFRPGPTPNGSLGQPRTHQCLVVVAVSGRPRARCSMSAVGRTKCQQRTGTVPVAELGVCAPRNLTESGAWTLSREALPDLSCHDRRGVR